MRGEGPLRLRLPAMAMVSYAYLAFGAAMTLALVVLRNNDLSAVPMTLVGLATATAVILGRRRHRPTVRFPWTLFAVACVAFIVGGALRQALVDQPSAPIADLATLTGYAATLLAFITLLRNRTSGGAGMHELVDGVIVLVAASSVALVFFTIPVVQTYGFKPVTVLQGAYPVIDVVMVFVVLLLSWTSAIRAVSFWLLAATITGVLIGDLGYAYIGTHGKLVGSPLLDLPFVIAFGCFGAAALHPSMVSLSAIQQRPVQAWSSVRLAILAPALIVPSVVMVVSDTRSSRWVCASVAAIVALLLLVRAVGAVHGHARSQRGLRHQAMHDALTGLANRANLVEKVDGFIRRADREGGRVDLLFLDLDAFKLVNDTWGHQVGDQVLRGAAARLLEIAEPSDVVARIGGDEFVVAHYVGGDHSRPGESLAADIIDGFRAPLDASESAMVATVSVGLTRSVHPATAEGLLRDADTAMYRAKDAGRNRCVTFDTSMHDAVRRRVETELALRYALDRGELVLFYQPIVALQTADVVGVEALLRWAHPGMGMVSPLDFIPVAEETGLIVEIGEWVVSEALRQLRRWHDEGAEDLWVSVNVSARQLRDASLVEHVEAELARHQVPADKLVLEITESAMMTDEATSAALLGRLHSLGVPLAVDDFGTGYSSLGHLRRFPVSKVKIDRTFVSGVDTDTDDAEIVRAVVAMSLAMGLEVVAEGIETEGQRALLHQTGVPFGQGWLFGRPAPAEDCRFAASQPARAKS